LSKGKEKIVPTLKVKAVDTTGAGDAFIGCFAEHYAACGDIEAAMERASLYAALSVTKKGTQDSYAERAEFEEFVKNH
jgi:ribokinase